MDIISEAYKSWKSQYKLSLRTFNDEQMFQFGFQSANAVSEVMEKIISDLQTQVEDLTKRIDELNKPKPRKSSE